MRVWVGGWVGGWVHVCVGFAVEYGRAGGDSCPSAWGAGAVTREVSCVCEEEGGLGGGWGRKEGLDL